MTFETDLNIVTISIIFGIIGILSTILFQLRNIRNDHTVSQRIALEEQIKTRTESEYIRKEFKDHLEQLERKFDRLEAILFRLPKESNSNAWY